MIEKIKSLLAEIENLSASTVDELEALRIKYLSKKGLIPSLMEEFRHVPADQKREVGMMLNELKQKAQDKIQSLKKQFENSETAYSDLDLSRTA
ncbi:MAG TPA: phenylalanine--tRNA ligase subunit alpha, partial [Dysgonamonadaceae bacterium]|nr:phenylalanine--tRNA ligase subunit alpha [Dysgonamonadaceae bacterium]